MASSSLSSSSFFYNSNVTPDPSTWLGPNDRGHMYLELYLPFPWLKNLYMDWETKINNEPVFNQMVAWTPILPVCRLGALD